MSCPKNMLLAQVLDYPGPEAGIRQQHAFLILLTLEFFEFFALLSCAYFMRQSHPRILAVVPILENRNGLLSSMPTSLRLFIRKSREDFARSRSRIGTFLSVFPCVTIHVRVVFPLLTVFHMCPYVSALRYDSKVNCDVYSSRFLLNTIICARQLSLNILYAVAYTRSLNCFCIILYFPPIFLQSDNILCQRYTVFLVPLLLVDTQLGQKQSSNSLNFSAKTSDDIKQHPIQVFVAPLRENPHFVGSHISFKTFETFVDLLGSQTKPSQFSHLLCNVPMLRLLTALFCKQCIAICTYDFIPSDMRGDMILHHTMNDLLNSPLKVLDWNEL